ncbi:MAG: hypothetical protein KF849_10880 [Rhizobiaceae bacterium]|nr:hypothetical protein [Rhizobiaceae bacterium]
MDESLATSTDPEVLCLTARRRASVGKPFSRHEVETYLRLMDDLCWVPDPDDPPSYDWTGGTPVAGGGKMQVRAEAARALKTCGGSELEIALGGMLDAHGKHSAELTVELLGGRHPLMLTLLADVDPTRRAQGLRGFAPLRWQNEQYLDLLAPLLADDVLEVAELTASLVRQCGYRVAGGVSSPQLGVALAKARRRFDEASGDARGVRIEGLAYLALLAKDRAELARLMARVTDAEMNQLVALPGFGVDAIQGVLDHDVTLRLRVKSAAFAFFRAGRPGSRFHELAPLTCFAPDRDALKLALEEVRCRASAGIEMARFARVAPSSTDAIVEAAFTNARRESVEASGFKALIDVDPARFAQALVAAPDKLQNRLARLDTLLTYLPSRQDGIDLMQAVRSHVDRLSQKK